MKPRITKIKNYTRERREWLRDTFVQSVAARIRARKKNRA